MEILAQKLPRFGRYRLSGALEKFIEFVEKKIRPQFEVSRINSDGKDSFRQTQMFYNIIYDYNLLTHMCDHQIKN